jgi:peptidoglycan/xylan/chitin deacetylase (PgdA/CDA1 family)
MGRRPALLAALVPLLVVGLGVWGAVGPGHHPTDHATAADVARVEGVVAHPRPLDNDCSAGHVAFTFDDGPAEHTRLTMRTLQALRLHAVFFVEGRKLDSADGRATLRALAAHGFGIGNHTMDHRSFTGASTDTAPLDDAQVAAEIRDAARAIEHAGGPRTRYFRPPYGDIDAHSAAVVDRLGYQLVMSWGTPAGHVIDSRDWAGDSAAQIVRTVTHGRVHDGSTYPPAADGTVVAMHDGEDATTLHALAALQPIVDWMNRRHLCSAATLPADTTGGVVSGPAPRTPPTGGLVRNASLEERLAGRLAPRCFELGGTGRGHDTARWRLTTAARTGHRAVRLDVTSWSGGDRKLVTSQKGSDAGCLAPVRPGHRLQTWVHYRGTWPAASGASSVRLTTYYRTRSGGWRYWTEGPVVPSSGRWATAYLLTPPVPTGATAVSFGLGLRGVGHLVVDDFAMDAS